MRRPTMWAVRPLTMTCGFESLCREPALPGTHINPDLAMGENLAELGGLSIALDAYHRSLGGKPAPVIGGLTGDQRVFLGRAQVWARQPPRRFSS